MKFYFDTNCIRKIRGIESANHKDIYTSFITILETISGINSKSEFIKRKAILETINNSKVKIIWDSPRSILSKAFCFELADTDVEATKIMMEKIIESNSYKDALEINFTVLNSEAYSLNTFMEYDFYYSTGISSTINESILKISKDQRKELRDYALEASHVQVYSEEMVRNFLMDQLNIDSVNDTYFKCLENYAEYDYSLSDYFRGLSYGILNSVTNGQNFGKNDGFDYAHLIYSNVVDYFVSDDKIYKRIPEITLDIKCIDFNEYKDAIKI